MKESIIPYGRHSISQADIDAVISVLKSDWLTQGPVIEGFEQAVAEYCGAKYAVAVNSATSALHIACLAAGLGEGNVLWTSPNTFVASANCALYCGAGVDFVDIDSRTYNMSAYELEKKLTIAGRDGKKPMVVIPVHFAGQSCEMDRIRELSVEHGFTVIEDASHAIGGRHKDTVIGSCSFSDMTVFSFHPVKIITTGEGGMVLTNRRDLFEKLVRLRSHGITRDSSLMSGGCHGPWYYQQVELGFNYRMTDILAALGLNQIQRLDEFVEQRHRLVERYNNELIGLPLVLPWQAPDCRSSFHLYVIRLRLDEIGKSHRRVFDDLRSAGIMVNLHYIPVHTQPFYEKLGFRSGDFPEAEKYYAEAISLPLYPSMSRGDQDRVITALREAVA